MKLRRGVAVSGLSAQEFVECVSILESVGGCASIGRDKSCIAKRLSVDMLFCGVVDVVITTSGI